QALATAFSPRTAGRGNGINHDAVVGRDAAGLATFQGWAHSEARALLGKACQIFAMLPLAFRNWCIGLAITTVGVIASYHWVDQPIAFFVHRYVVDKSFFDWLQRLPEAFPLLSLVALGWCGLWTVLGRPFSRVQCVTLACSLSFIATGLIV